jgi:adenosine deaminase|nr:adenosine deaminase [Candidatus Krumholzibacteria bacterium]
MDRIELHTHLEGSVTPARLIAQAEKYGQPGLPLACLDETGTRYRFAGFHGFLDLYKNVTLLLKEPADFRAITLDLGQQLARDEVGYAEVIVSFGVMKLRGLDPLPLQHAIWEAAQQVQETHGVTMRFLPDAVRQFGRDEAMRVWEAAATCGRALGVVGFGLGGDETAGPASNFASLCEEVRREGLGLSFHAGEVTAMGRKAADSVRQAVEVCGADRIGHGLAAPGDPLVMGLLAARGTFVELCPRSNVATGNLRRLADHPVRAFLDAGIPCCLNTDDRTLFDLDLAGEYAAAVETLDLTEAEVTLMHEQARQAAFGP